MARFRNTVTRRFFNKIATFVLCFSPLSAYTQFPGGFIEQGAGLTAVTEPLMSRAEIQGFLPQRGLFTFPSPYNTQGIRLTNATDCGGADCVNAVGYSYWRNINNHVGQDSMLILVGLDRARGGAGLSLLQYNKLTNAVTSLGPVFDSASPHGWASGEGWYFSATLPTKMYLNYGSRILRYDVFSKQFETIVDVGTRLGSGYQLHQIHSSDDDRVHSATVRNAATYAILGCMAYETDTGRFHYFPVKGAYDECQVDRSGRWLVIKEDVDRAEAEDNRIIDLATGTERVLVDSAGAGGHSDLGHGYMLAADNWAPEANTWKLWDFRASQLSGVAVYANKDWYASMPAHVSHANAKSSLAPERQYACGSSANRRNSAHANEIICFRLDDSRAVLVVAPVMTNLDSRAGGDYDNSPKGNLDVSGQYFIWTSNMGGSRLDAFLVKVPAHLLTGSTGTSTLTTQPLAGSTTAAQVSPEPVVWTDLVNVSAGAAVLKKTGGCDGCADAGAASVQTIGASGYLEFTATIENGLRFVGLGAGNANTTAADIDFSLRLQGSSLEVRERGLYRFGSGFKAGDVFRISVANGKVSYARNGKDFYTSTAVPAASLRADTAFYTSGTTISTAVIAVPSTQTVAPASIGPVAAQAVNWTAQVNVSASGGSLRKTSGCDGCADAGAVSAQQLAAGNGYLEFTATVENRLRVIGLSGLDGSSTMAIRHGLRLQGGIAEVRESGGYRAETSFQEGAVFRIAVENGRVTYARNGVVFHTSALAPTYPLRANSVFYSLDGSIKGAVMKTD